jgi:hypothetical protein
MAQMLANLSAYLRSGAALAEQQQVTRFPPLAVPALSPLVRELPRGALIEVTGPRSSGRMAVLLHVLAQATTRGEVCAILDTHDQFSPASAVAAGVQLARTIWVRCQNRPDQTLRAADLLLHAGGFGVVVLDFADVPEGVWNKVPVSWWHRFRRASENTPTIVLLCTRTAQARSCSRISIELTSPSLQWEGETPFSLLEKVQTLTHLRKPMGRSPSYLSIRAVS